MCDVYRRKLCVHPQRLASGDFESPEESSNGLRYPEPPLPPSRLAGSESAERSVIPKSTATL